MLLPIKPHGNSEKPRNVHRFTPFGSGTQILSSRQQGSFIFNAQHSCLVVSWVSHQDFRGFPKETAPRDIPPHQEFLEMEWESSALRYHASKICILNNSFVICFPHTSSVVLINGISHTKCDDEINKPFLWCSILHNSKSGGLSGRLISMVRRASIYGTQSKSRHILKVQFLTSLSSHWKWLRELTAFLKTALWVLESRKEALL